MKISVTTEELLDHLQTIARVASARSAIQALAGVQIEATGGSIELRATDQELSIRVPLAGEVGQDGTVVLPARLLLDVIRQLPGDSASLEYRGQEQDVEIVGGSARFHLRTLRNEDFPPLPDTAGDEAVALPAAEFVATIARVARAASRDETSPILTGVLVSADADKLRMVATDSYRLSIKETTLPSKISESFEANIPARALEELARLAGDDTETISVAVRENQAVFMVGDVALSTRLIEGQFPNFQQLLPDEFEHELRIPTEELLATARRISLLAQKNAPLRLDFSEGELIISAQTPDVGEASEKMPVPFAGEPMEIGFNPEFLLAGLESAESEDVLLRLISPLRPGLIVSGDDSGFLYLIMPIRLNV